MGGESQNSEAPLDESMDSDDEIMANLQKAVAAQQKKTAPAATPTLPPTAKPRPKTTVPLIFRFPAKATKNNPLEGVRVSLLGTFTECATHDEFVQLLKNMGAEIAPHIDKGTNLVIFGQLQLSTTPAGSKKQPEKPSKNKKNASKTQATDPQPAKSKPQENSDSSDGEGADRGVERATQLFAPFLLRRALDHPHIKTAMEFGIPAVCEAQFMNDFYNRFGVNPIQNNRNNPNLVGKLRALQRQSVVLSQNPGKLWVEIFAPKCSKDIIGNEQTLDSLRKFIQEFYQKGPSKGRYRAALLAGPPGIGKTTAARIVAEEMGYRTIIQNASDSRNKTDVSRFVGTLKDNTVLNQSFVTASETCVLIMDEVDGMSGDKGGVGALIDQIKETRVPIICICNDLNSSRLRSLLPYCRVLKFQEPTPKEIADLLRSIVSRVTDQSLAEKMIDYQSLVSVSNGDLRQAISNLQFEFLSDSSGILRGQVDNRDRDNYLSAHEATQRLINGSDIKTLDLKRMKNYFFCDFGLVPFHVFENYLGRSRTEPQPQGSLDDLLKVESAIDSLFLGDRMNRRMVETGNYSLLDAYSVASTIAPLVHMHPLTDPKISAFPSILGKISTINKKKRIFREIKERFSKLAAGLSNEMVSKMVLWFMEHVVNLYRKMNAGLASADETFQEIFDLCMDLDLDQVVLKEHFIEVASNLKADILASRFKQHLVQDFLPRFRERWGTDGVVGRMNGKRTKDLNKAVGREGAEEPEEAEGNKAEAEEPVDISGALDL